MKLEAVVLMGSYELTSLIKTYFHPFHTFGCLEDRRNWNPPKQNTMVFFCLFVLQSVLWFSATLAIPSNHDFLSQTGIQDLWINHLLSPQTYCFEVVFYHIKVLQFYFSLQSLVLLFFWPLFLELFETVGRKPFTEEFYQDHSWECQS